MGTDGGGEAGGPFSGAERTPILLGYDDGRIRFANEAAAELLEVPRHELSGCSWLEIFDGEQRERCAEALARALDHRGRVAAFTSKPHRPGDGELPHQVSCLLVGLPEEGFLAVLGGPPGLDLVGGERLRELDDARRALDTASIVAATDRRGRITFANDNFCAISGYQLEELLGQDHRLLNSGHHPRSFMVELWRTIGRGEIWHGEIRNRKKTGEPYWVDTTIVPFLDETGRPYQYFAIRNDITQRKLAEEKLVREATLVRLGEMAAVVAHEVKNPLAGIGGALALIRDRMPASGQEHEVLGDVLERLDSLTELIDDLLIYARPSVSSSGPVELRGLLDQVCRELPAGCCGAGVELDGAELVLPAHAEKLHRALLNLLLNACQASPPGVGVEVSWKVREGRCRLEIRDRGPGMDVEELEKVLEPFYTTRNQGTGLGLPIAQRTIEAHGGSLVIDSEPGKGTTVRVELPLEAAATG